MRDSDAPFIQQGVLKMVIPTRPSLTLSFMMLKNGQTYFKNLAVVCTPQDI